MSQRRISVVIPTYHRNDLLAKCLDCLSPGVQTLPNQKYEVIVTDDGSKSTAQQMICETYPWARWVAGPQKGPAANRNNGAKYATGEFLAFTDDDCLPDSGWLKAFYSAIMPGIEVYEGQTVCRKGLLSPLEHAPLNDGTGGYLWSCNMMVRKTVFEEMGGFDESFPKPHNMEDIDLRERFKKQGYHFPFVKEATVDHPPRRLAWGARLGREHESAVLLWYKDGNHKSIALSLLILIFKIRLLWIIRARLQKDSILAIISMCLELAYVATQVGRWEKKYRLQFKTNSASNPNYCQGANQSVSDDENYD